MIHYRQARTLSLCSYIILIIDVVLVLVYAKFDLDPKLVFYIDSIALVLMVEVFNICIMVSLSMRAVPVQKCVPRITKFYVRPPGPPSPCRQNCPPPTIQSPPSLADLLPPPGRFVHPGFKTVQLRRRTGRQAGASCSQIKKFSLEIFSIDSNSD